MATIAYLAERSRKIGLSMQSALKRGDKPGVAKWALRQADVSTSLAVAINPALALEEEDEIAVEVPNYGYSRKISGILYGLWVRDWLRASFPAAFIDWPAKVHAIEPLDVATKAKADGCLAQVCAGSGVLGNPEGPWASLGDWSLFTGAVMEAGVAQVWIMGEKVAEEPNGDAWALGTKHGLEML